MQEVKSVLTDPGQNETRFAKVLLIDDNNLDNVVNKKIIEISNFAAVVDMVENASEALTYLQNTETEALPELIFLDIMMPGMDGFHFLDEYAKLGDEIHQRCKIIMLSTSESFKDLNRANKNRFVRKFLNKPLSEQVLEAINV